MVQPSRVVTGLYVLTAVLCPLAAIAGGDHMLWSLLLYAAAPLSAASIALAVASWWLSVTRVDIALAVLWACAAPTLCVPIPADNYPLFLVLVNTHAALVGGTALVLSIKALDTARRVGPVLPRVLHCGGLAVLALLFVRSTLLTFVVEYSQEYPRWLGTISEELKLFCVVAVASSIAVALAGVWGRAHRTGSIRRA